MNFFWLLPWNLVYYNNYSILVFVFVFLLKKTQQLPPVRSHLSANTHMDRKKRKKKIDRVKKPAAVKRITSYDYNAWDKFDVVCLN